jgi:hypothetical protein
MQHAFRQAPKSNAERQRKFRAANPGYFNKYNNRRKAQRIAGQKWALGVIKALAQAKAAALQQQQQQQQPAPPQSTPLTLPTKPLLMLPAPVQDPMMAELNALRASLKSGTAAREHLPIRRAA